jgi:DNA-binding MarR family transcriptional regulator
LKQVQKCKIYSRLIPLLKQCLFLSSRNEAKYETLKYIEDRGFATGSEISEYRGVTHGAQSTLLKRYWKYGLLHRCTGEGKEKIYTLSERGYERLEWLEEQFEDACFEGPDENLKRCRIKKNEESLDFLKKTKRCRVLRTDDDYIEIEFDPLS